MLHYIHLQSCKPQIHNSGRRSQASPTFSLGNPNSLTGSRDFQFPTPNLTQHETQGEEMLLVQTEQKVKQ